IVFLLLILFIFYMKIGKKSILMISVVVLSVFLTFIRYPQLDITRNVELVGEIYYVKENEIGNTYYLKTDKANFVFYSDVKFTEGDIVKISGNIQDVSGENNFKT